MRKSRDLVLNSSLDLSFKSCFYQVFFLFLPYFPSNPPNLGSSQVQTLNFSPKIDGWKQKNLEKAFFGMNFTPNHQIQIFFSENFDLPQIFSPNLFFFMFLFPKHQFLSPSKTWKIGSIGCLGIVKAIKGLQKFTFFMEFHPRIWEFGSIRRRFAVWVGIKSGFWGKFRKNPINLTFLPQNRLGVISPFYPHGFGVEGSSMGWVGISKVREDPSGNAIPTRIRQPGRKFGVTLGLGSPGGLHGTSRFRLRPRIGDER